MGTFRRHPKPVWHQVHSGCERAVVEGGGVGRSVGVGSDFPSRPRLPGLGLPALRRRRQGPLVSSGSGLASGTWTQDPPKQRETAHLKKSAGDHQALGLRLSDFASSGHWRFLRVLSWCKLNSNIATCSGDSPTLTSSENCCFFGSLGGGGRLWVCFKLGGKSISQTFFGRLIKIDLVV